MEGQYMPAAGEPQRVRDRKPNIRTNQGVQGQQQPPIRKTKQQQQQSYPENYNYGGEHVAAHEYRYDGAQGAAAQDYHGYGDVHVDAAQDYHGYGGAQADASQDYHGYGGAQGDATQDYHGYDGAQADASQDYHGYGGAQRDATQDYHGYGGGQGDAAQDYHGYGDAQGYVAPHYERANAGQDYDYGGAHMDGHQGHGYGYDGAHVAATQGYGYSVAQADPGYGRAQANAGQDYGYAAPTQQVKGKAKKSRNPQPDGVYPNEYHGGYEPAGDGYGAYPEPYNAVPENRNPLKPTKNRKPSRTKSFENGNQGDSETALASPWSGISHGPGEADGSGRSRTSQDGSGSNRSKPDGSGRIVNDATSSNRRVSNRLEQDRAPSGTRKTTRTRSKEKVDNEGNKVEKPPAEPKNPLNEHLRKTNTAKPKQPAIQDMSMTVFDPQDRTLITGIPQIQNPKPQPKDSSVRKNPPPPTRPSLDEWMKQQPQTARPKFQQDESLIVFDDHDKSDLNMEMFGAPLAKKQSMKLPPPVAEPRESYQQHQVEKPLYQPGQRRPYVAVNSPLPNAYHEVPHEGGAIQEYNAAGKQVAVPNAKCMACVHGIGVPLARAATRIACRQCWMCACTIL